ncbi:MAG: hypothetical protein OXF26_03495 [Alphaproteobacteria bacterium]|nr:hypothetical protein [Alphaproteobacteria bacterium]MCY4229946.1 hypothetical protein [Alphaproteobacteria bacterium]MCY4317962.1 hypothetical protein [Alphaproteobacteria bacterium]
MAGDKVKVEVELNPDMLTLLDDAVKDYRLADRSKALRCLLDWLAADGDRDTVFKKIRCRRC